MRAIVQAVAGVSVEIDRSAAYSTGRGYLVLLGVAQGDTRATADKLADKVSLVRSWRKPDGDLDIHLRDVHGEVMVVCDQSVLARCIRGRRPIFNDAADSQTASELLAAFKEYFSKLGLKAVGPEAFQDVVIRPELDGPVTYVIDSVNLE